MEVFGVPTGEPNVEIHRLLTELQSHPEPISFVLHDFQPTRKLFADRRVNDMRLLRKLDVAQSRLDELW